MQSGYLSFYSSKTILALQEFLFKAKRVKILNPTIQDFMK